MVIGTVPLLAFGDSRTQGILLHLSLPGWLALALLSLGSTVVATILWNYGVTRTTSARAGLFLYLVPLVSVTGGVLFLREQVGFVTFIGGGFIVAGVALAQVRHVPSFQKSVSKERVLP